MATQTTKASKLPATSGSEAMGLGALVGLGIADQDALIWMAAAEEASGKIRDALETLHVAASLCPLRPAPWAAMAGVLRRSGAHERADVIETFIRGLNDADAN